jgi:uncharacterized membrane protein
MATLGRTARSILLGFHILCAATWMGGVAALLLVSVIAAHPGSAEAIALARELMRWVDRVLIIPACLGSLGTGFLFAWRTSWGFFRHTWLSIKWVLTVAMILFGIFFLGPWVDHTAALAAARAAGAGGRRLRGKAARVFGFGSSADCAVGADGASSTFAYRKRADEYHALGRAGARIRGQRFKQHSRHLRWDRCCGRRRPLGPRVETGVISGGWLMVNRPGGSSVQWEPLSFGAHACPFEPPHFA